MAECFLWGQAFWRCFVAVEVLDVGCVRDATITVITISFDVVPSSACTFLGIDAYPWVVRQLDVIKLQDIMLVLEACCGRSCEDVEGDLDRGVTPAVGSVIGHRRCSKWRG